MSSHLSIKSLKAKDFTLVIQSGFSIALILSLASCSSFKTDDYSVKDSLYIWSDSFFESNETNVEYQTIRSLEESILKSDVELIFDAMVNNQVAEKQLAPVALEIPINDDPLPKQEIELVETFIESDLKPQTEPTIVTQVVQNSQSDIESVKSLESLESIDAINRLTLQNPAAAGIPVSQVLPEIQKEVAEVELPKEILLLAAPSDYQLDVNEFGMWKLVKNENSQYQEVCSLSSSTIQVEVENYSTQVWLTVVGSDLLVNSTTNIDIGKPRVGVQFDNGSLQAFKKNYFQTSAVWSGDLDTALNNNKQLNISLGGNELGRRTQELAIGLSDLKKAYSEYRQCNRGTQIGSL
jgi:hypothetical protein